MADTRKKGEGARIAVTAFLAALTIVDETEPGEDRTGEKMRIKYEAFLAEKFPTLENKVDLIGSTDVLSHMIENFFKPLLLLSAAKQYAHEHYHTKQTPSGMVS